MQLNLFLQLTKDLNPNYSLYYRPSKKGKSYPITKATISGQECIFETKNSYAKTLADIQKILHHIHQTNINLLIDYKKEKSTIYGIQIDLSKNIIYLL
ncbi:hypothetical protein [Lactobacillus sp.]|uniref:hypothetical protein n=1 Tax=Lactobacillus sp. TaxID=1591 RepID=UPI00199152EB|nr:hypothetical protein [Lactobacillus sp.]MBD5430310.1 hypothetical protein [Lactobacillus sp.]